MKARIPGGMGGGPQNMNAMIRQAQKMQEDMEALQADLDAREYDISLPAESLMMLPLPETSSTGKRP